MNENNQPQSQQTKREPGYYWVKMEGFQWRIAGWNGSEWTVPGSLNVFGDDWFEIDERRIERKHDNSCPYCAPDGTIWNGDSSRICPHCDGSHVFDPIEERDKRIKELEATLHQKEMEFTQLLAEFKDKQP